MERGAKLPLSLKKNMAYKLIQLTNTQIGSVTADEFMPLGVVTRRIGCGQSCDCTKTFIPTTAGNNAVTITESGYYKISYTASLVAGAAGLVTETLFINGVAVPGATVSQTATAVGDTANISIVYVVRIPCGGSPVNLQITNAGVALTGGTSNLVIEKI